MSHPLHASFVAYITIYPCTQPEFLLWLVIDNSQGIYFWSIRTTFNNHSSITLILDLLNILICMVPKKCGNSLLFAMVSLVSYWVRSIWRRDGHGYRYWSLLAMPWIGLGSPALRVREVEHLYCICMHNIYSYSHIYIYIHIYIFIFIYIHIYIHIYIFTFILAFISMFVYVRYQIIIKHGTKWAILTLAILSDYVFLFFFVLLDVRMFKVSVSIVSSDKEVCQKVRSRNNSCWKLLVSG